MPTRNVNLTEHFDSFIESGITSGRFSNASEVVLRSAGKEEFDQLDRGEGIRFESLDDFEDYVDQIGNEVSVELAAGRKRG